MTSLAQTHEGVFQRRATWTDAQAAIGGLMLSHFGEWEDSEQSSARFPCPCCGIYGALQLWPDGQDGKVGRQCNEGCRVGDIDRALDEYFGMRMRPLRPHKPRGEPLQGLPLDNLHPSIEGDARRMIESHGARLLIVDEDPKAYESVYVLDTDTGIWEPAPSAFFALHCDTAKTAAQLSFEKHLAGEIPAAVDQEIRRWAKKTHNPQYSDACRKAMAGAYIGMVNEGKNPTIGAGNPVKAAELNADKRFLGCGNGVVDLDTGELLTPDEGAGKLITRSTGVEYRPDARDDVIDALLGHLPDDERDYLLNATAYALRGNPARRWYVLAGPGGSGKTTFLNAVAAALGDADANGYHIGLTSGALLRDKNASANAHSDHLKHFPHARLATGNELPDGGQRFNEGLLKDLTGSGNISVRELGRKSTGARPATATLMIAVNPKDLDRLSLLDSALAMRTAILQWPSPPWIGTPDVARVDDVTRPGAAAAMLAILVSRARTLKAPPAMPASVASAVETKRAESLGALGAWLQQRVIITGNGFDYILPDVLWEKAYHELEGKDDKIGGAGRRGMIGLLREVLPGLPAQKLRRINGKRLYVYAGVTLLDEYEADAIGLSCPSCGREQTGAWTPDEFGRCPTCCITAEGRLIEATDEAPHGGSRQAFLAGFKARQQVFGQHTVDFHDPIQVHLFLDGWNWASEVLGLPPAEQLPLDAEGFNGNGRILP